MAAPRSLLLAGSQGPERVPVRPDRDESRWYEPLHVRHEVAARDRIADQVAAGADFVVAPTWLTHRRALLPLGETRRARDWTMAAIRIARDGVEVGLERRAEAAQRGDGDSGTADAVPAYAASGDDDGPADEKPDRPPDRPLDRPRPLVAAVLPALDEEPESGSGRLLPRDAATERDYRDQAGLLADAEPDVLLVEGQRTLEEARTATSEASATGLPTWAAASLAFSPADDGAALARWVETTGHAGAAMLLLPPPIDQATSVASDLRWPWGGLLQAPTRLAGQAVDWLATGVAIVGLLNGATADAVAEIRGAIDEREQADVRAQEAIDGRWADHVARAAQMASGGAALWLGTAPRGPLPDGFEWLVVDAEEVRQLPSGHYRLIVEPTGQSAEGADLGSLLVEGGIVAMPQSGTALNEPRLRVLSIDTATQPALAILRRED